MRVLQLCYAVFLVLGAPLGLSPGVAGGDAGGDPVLSIESDSAVELSGGAPVKISKEENACCSAFILEEGATSFGRDGRYILPLEW